MASDTCAICNQYRAPSVQYGKPLADTSSTGAGSSSDASSASITANDFLTLLVTEMKNQDPTANTDPNEYINQLVQVNSLQQLIAINETLTDAVGSGTTPGADARSATDASRSVPGTAVQGAAGPSSVAGNLSLPAANNSALRVASSIGTR